MPCMKFSKIIIILRGYFDILLNLFKFIILLLYNKFYYYKGVYIMGVCDLKNVSFCRYSIYSCYLFLIK